MARARRQDDHIAGPQIDDLAAIAAEVGHVLQAANTARQVEPSVLAIG
jgi:hypothetical protein